MKILVAIDFSNIADKLLQQARLLGKAMSAEVVLMHVAEPNPDHIAYDYDPAAMYAIDPSEIRKQIAERFHREHRQLQQMAERLRADGIDCKALMVQGPTVDMLLGGVERLGIDFIIAGSHGKGLLSQILLGSSSEELVKKATIPVLLVPADKE